MYTEGSPSFKKETLLAAFNLDREYSFLQSTIRLPEGNPNNYATPLLGRAENTKI